MRGTKLQLADVQRASTLSPVAALATADPVPVPPGGAADDRDPESPPTAVRAAFGVDPLLLAPAVGLAIACFALLVIGGVLLRRSLRPVG